ncbi:MAG: DUF3352 domain-containing protein [Chloroflexi bacterium]|nr:DUF3352 domain-containing protein [Chloroflexota bacterium]
MAVGVALAIFATGGKTTEAAGPTYLPPTTIAYVEARFDLPGDQRDNLVSFVGAFPGFDDPANFDLKINDVLDRLTRDASGDRLTYTGDIKPWFEGEFAFGGTSLQAELLAPSSGSPSSAAKPPVVGALSVSDRAELDAFLARQRTFAQESGASFTETQHEGTTIVTWQQPDSPAGSVSYAVTDDLLLFSLDIDDLREALDIRAGKQPSLADSEALKTQFAALPAERLGAVYFDFASVWAALQGQLGSMAQALPPGFSPDQLPRAVVGAVRVESDRLAIDVRLVPGPATPIPPVRDSGLAARLPSTTAFYTEHRDIGQVTKSFITQFKAQAGSTIPDSQLRQIEDFLGTPLEDFLTWVQDLGLAVSIDGDRFGVGIIATVTDETIAIQRIERLTAAARAAAAFGDLPFEVVEADVGGVMVTTFRLKGALAASVPDDLPFEPSLSYAIRDGVFMLGLGDFVPGVLQRASTDSLASNGGYSSAIDAAGGATNAGVVYLDIAAIRAAAERFIPAQERAAYDTDTRPFIEPLDRFVGIWTVQDGTLVMRVLLYVE